MAQSTRKLARGWKAIKALVNTTARTPEGLDPLQMKLFTPGPVTTSEKVKSVMLHDLGLGEQRAKNNIEFIRQSILKIAGVKHDTYTVIPIPGCGTFAVEAAVYAATPRNGKVLVLTNGYFGENFVHVCKHARLNYEEMRWPLGTAVNVRQLEEHLQKQRDYSAVTVVHHETSCGIMNPLKDIGLLRMKYLPDAAFVVDAVSSFGCYPIDFVGWGVTYMVGTPSKCIESVPGFGFVVAEKKNLLNNKSINDSYSLNLLSEYYELESQGETRFTYPTNVFLACEEALREYFYETAEKRMARYKRNNTIIRDGMKKLGFQPFLKKSVDATYMLTAYTWPTHPLFDWNFYQMSLEARGMFVYPESLTKDVRIYRVGNMGRLSSRDCNRFVRANSDILNEMEVSLPNPTDTATA